MVFTSLAVAASHFRRWYRQSAYCVKVDRNVDTTFESVCLLVSRTLRMRENVALPKDPTLSKRDTMNQLREVPCDGNSIHYAWGQDEC